MLGMHGGTVEACHTLGEMERARPGCQQYFKDPGDGWIECLVARI